MPININRVFERDWQLSRPIKLTDIQDPYLRDVLSEGDANHDGQLTMREARDYLIKNSQVLQDPKHQNFLTHLRDYIEYATGIRAELTNPDKVKQPHICYVQLNNPQNRTLVEEADLKAMAAADTDNPSLDKINMTAQFNTQGDVASATTAFKDNVRSYFENLIAKNERMSAFIISGHSNGTDMLEEAEDHTGGEHLYYANLDVREALGELRAENPAYAKLMDGCETVAALACFQGNATTQWRQLFPNAAAGGTPEFAPLSNDHRSAAIYAAAKAASQALEDGKSNIDAFQAAKKVVGAASLWRANNLRVDIGTSTDELEAKIAMALARYNTMKSEIEEILEEGRVPTFSQTTFDDAYRLAKQYEQAVEELWKAEGEPEGDRQREVEMLRYQSNVLFAARKNTPIPPMPTNLM